MSDAPSSPPASAPVDLQCDGAQNPLALRSRRPTFSWLSPVAATARQVRVETDDGVPVWDSGKVAGSAPSQRYDGPVLTDRLRLRWQVRVWGVEDAVSAWSEPRSFETGLMDRGSWRASWIARPVGAGSRAHRAIGRSGIEWVTPGTVLAQPVPTPDGTTLVAADLIEREGRPSFLGRLELVTIAGDVIAGVDLKKDGVPLDHFARFIDVPEGTAATGNSLRLTVEEGEVGWVVAAEAAETDDGVSPLPILSPYHRDGREAPGVLAAGVEVRPAPNPEFKYPFFLSAEPLRARLYATGLGYGRFDVNAQPVTDATLEPAQTDYDEKVLYSAHDVTHLLRRGDNEIFAALGRGFWSVRGGDTWGWHLASWNKEPQLFVQLEVDLADGTSVTIASDESWSAREGAVISDLLYTGVTYDLGTQAGWGPVTAVPAPSGELRPSVALPVRRKAPIAPVRSWTTDRGSEVLDFGRTLAGRIRCRLSARTAGELTMRHGEVVTDDGTVLCENPLAAGEAQVDRVRTDGPLDSVEWEPDFTYKGFRYVEVFTDGDLTAHDVVAVPLQADVRSVGSFESDEETLNWIDSALARTFLNNLHGVPTDTPAYEKNGWTADAHLGVTAALQHVDLRWTMAKWLEDHADGQQHYGGVPQIVPSPGWGLATDPAWSASAVLIPWDLWQEYGDADLLADHLPMIIRYVDDALARVEAEGWIWRAHGWGDWLAPGHQFPPEGAAPTSTMMLLQTAQRAADICDALDRREDAERYRHAVGRLAEAYHEEYFDVSTRTYRVAGVDYRQSMNILPLAFHAVPAADHDSVFSGLVDDLQHRTDRHLDCGAASIKQLLPVLADRGRPDLALDVLLQRTRPGWSVWRQDSDTLWESWDPDARSRNHYFLGSVAAWIQQRVGGLRATAPGWSQMTFAPVSDERVRHARMFHETPYGTAGADWSRSGSSWDIELTIPPGTTVSVELPKAQPVVHREGLHALRITTP